MATGGEKALKISTVVVGIETLEKRNFCQCLVGKVVLLRPFLMLRVRRRTFAFAVGVNGIKPSKRESTVTCQTERVMSNRVAGALTYFGNLRPGLYSEG